jgi:hypothetical protein
MDSVVSEPIYLFEREGGTFVTSADAGVPELVDDLDWAKEFAASNGGQVYTQVDADNDRVVYLRGVHLVNRTGVYAVAFGYPKKKYPAELFD